jgi:predicted RecB family nuclease
MRDGGSGARTMTLGEMQSRNGQLTFSPSDLTAYLACEHLTQLERQVALGARPRPQAENPQADLVKRKGEEHERAYLEGLHERGLEIAEISLQPDLDWERAARETREAIARGVDIVFQAVFADGEWRGVADFLERQADGFYQAVDTKLARNAKPAHILQLCFYTEQLGRIQEREAERFHVELGSGERQSFRLDEFAAYYQRVRRRFVDFASVDHLTEPYPCPHCDGCDFKELCEERWEAVDHLSRTARITRAQVDRLEVDGITTLTQLGQLAPGTLVTGISAPTSERLRDQARLQLSPDPEWEVLQPEPEMGFALLPESSAGDLFFDIEGNPFWDTTGSLEYLWGFLDLEGSYDALWAKDRDSEQAAFERFVDAVGERLERWPDLHVYHYGAYEITALRRLMGRYGTREDEVDDFLRQGVFVDLYAVVRRGLRASVRGYGLKELEIFLDFKRRAAVKDGGTSIVMFEEWMQTGEQGVLDVIAEYNQEDCEATLLLRDWLLVRRAEAVERFGPIPMPELKPSRDPDPRDAERAQLREDLLALENDGAVLAAHLLDYHDRERKPVWWAFFDQLEQAPEELVEDPESIGQLELLGAPEQAKRSLAYTLTFPPQEHKLGQGHDPVDPATRHVAGEITQLDREQRRLVLKRGPSLADVPLPQALIPGRPFDTPCQEDALARIGSSLLAGNGRYPAAESILRRTPFSPPIQTTDLDEIKQIVRGLDRRHLFIQGPPGSGKTWTGARLIVELLGRGQSVGVASTSHKAIHNLIAEVEDVGPPVEGRKKASAGNPDSFYGSEQIVDVTTAAECVGAAFAAGTAWLFSRPEFDGALDYLFIDEAGQVSLADALAMGTCARNIILLGDPLQLGQVNQGTHPGGSEVSVLDYLLGAAGTIPPDRGIFLERTFRLHPDICRYISEAFYERRLQPNPSCAERTTPFGTGLRYIPVEHEHRRQESPEEAERVGLEVERLAAAGVDDVLVVAAYNAQVNLLKERLPDARVGTVDKFQGQEADVVLYSLASSSGEDVPHNLDFLFSRNRLNVAISRARCLAYLVCSPRLLEVDCRTIEHMRLANALCRFVELADEAAA